MAALACVSLLALCWFWHRDRCRTCGKRAEIDIAVEKRAIQELVRVLEQRRAIRRARGVKR